MSDFVARGTDGVPRNFHHPFITAWIAIVANLLCGLTYVLILYFYRIKNIERICIAFSHLSAFQKLTAGNTKFNPFIFLYPAILYFLIVFLYVFIVYLKFFKSLEIIFGCEIFFTALFSVLMLNRKYGMRIWFSIIIAMFGLCLANVTNILEEKHQESEDIGDKLAGNVLAIIYMFTFALRVVYEEKYMVRYDAPPLLVIGYEGVFGIGVLLLCSSLLPFVYVGPPYVNNSRGSLIDPLDAINKIQDRPLLIIPICFSTVLITVMNYVSYTLRKDLSSVTTSMLIPPTRLMYWLFSLSVGWTSFTAYQITGYIIAPIGCLLYNDTLSAGVYEKLLKIFKKTDIHQSDPGELFVTDRPTIDTESQDEKFLNVIDRESNDDAH